MPEARTLVRCACGELNAWRQAEEDPGAEQPLGPYPAQQCSRCGARLQTTWLNLRRQVKQRVTGTVSGAFPRVAVACLPAGLVGAALGWRLFNVSPVGRLIGALFGFVFMAAAIVVVAAQWPSVLPGWWGYGHGRCPCGVWLREPDRVDGFNSPETPDDDSLWIAIYQCPSCARLLSAEVSFGSFV